MKKNIEKVSILLLGKESLQLLTSIKDMGNVVIVQEQVNDRFKDPIQISEIKRPETGTNRKARRVNKKKK